MSTKITKKPVSPRVRQKKKKHIQNTFDLVQFKKMIGKGLVLCSKGVVLIQDPSIKDKILTKQVRSISMNAVLSAGIIYVTEHPERLAAISAISYAEIKKYDLDVDVIINQM